MVSLLLLLVACGNMDNSTANSELEAVNSSAEKSPTDEVLIEFNNQDMGLSFKHSKEWSVDLSQVESVIVSLNSSINQESNINVAYYLLKENEYNHFDETIKQFIDDYKNQFEDYELLSYGVKEHNGLRFIEAKFSALFGGKKLVLTQYVTQKEHVAFYITSTTIPEHVDELLLSVETILESMDMTSIRIDYFEALEPFSEDNEIMYVEYNNENGITFNIPESYHVTNEVSETVYMIYGNDELIDRGFMMALGDFGNYDERIDWIKNEIEPSAHNIYDQVQINMDFSNGQSIVGYLVIYSGLDDAGVEKKFANFLGRSPNSENGGMMLSFDSIIDGQSEMNLMNIFDEFVRTLDFK